jgi:hypothetical protein
MKAPRDEIIQLMKQADLRKFIIEKYTTDCPFHGDCPWCKLEYDKARKEAIQLMDDNEKKEEKGNAT